MYFSNQHVLGGVLILVGVFFWLLSFRLFCWLVGFVAVVGFVFIL